MIEHSITPTIEEFRARIKTLETALLKLVAEEPQPLIPGRLDHAIYFRHARLAQEALNAQS